MYWPDFQSANLHYCNFQENPYKIMYLCFFWHHLSQNLPISLKGVNFEDLARCRKYTILLRKWSKWRFHRTFKRSVRQFGLKRCQKKREVMSLFKNYNISVRKKALKIRPVQCYGVNWIRFKDYIRQNMKNTPFCFKNDDTDRIIKFSNG